MTCENPSYAPLKGTLMTSVYPTPCGICPACEEDKMKDKCSCGAGRCKESSQISLPDTFACKTHGLDGPHYTCGTDLQEKAGEYRAKYLEGGEKYLKAAKKYSKEKQRAEKAEAKVAEVVEACTPIATTGRGAGQARWCLLCGQNVDLHSHFQTCPLSSLPGTGKVLVDEEEKRIIQRVYSLQIKVGMTLEAIRVEVPKMTKKIKALQAENDQLKLEVEKEKEDLIAYGRNFERIILIGREKKRERELEEALQIMITRVEFQNGEHDWALKEVVKNAQAALEAKP